MYERLRFGTATGMPRSLNSSSIGRMMARYSDCVLLGMEIETVNVKPWGLVAG